MHCNKSPNATVTLEYITPVNRDIISEGQHTDGRITQISFGGGGGVEGFLKIMFWGIFRKHYVFFFQV